MLYNNVFLNIYFLKLITIGMISLFFNRINILKNNKIMKTIPKISTNGENGRMMHTMKLIIKISIISVKGLILII